MKIKPSKSQQSLPEAPYKLPDKNKHKLSEKKIVRKIKSALQSVGHEAISHALMLYYTLQEPNTPIWCRTVILGSLGYFISIIDGIPDLTPFLGYTDDITVMAAAVATLSQYITPEIKQKSEHKADKLIQKNDSSGV